MAVWPTRHSHRGSGSYQGMESWGTRDGTVSLGGRHLQTILHLSIEEPAYGGICPDLVGTLVEAVPFILEAQIFYGDAPRLKRCNDLLGLTDGHARVVGAMHDEQRRGDSVYLVNGRDAFQKCSIIL